MSTNADVRPDFAHPVEGDGENGLWCTPVPPAGQGIDDVDVTPFCNGCKSCKGCNFCSGPTAEPLA